MWPIAKLYYLTRPIANITSCDLLLILLHLAYCKYNFIWSIANITSCCLLQILLDVAYCKYHFMWPIANITSCGLLQVLHYVAYCKYYFMWPVCFIIILTLHGNFQFESYSNIELGTSNQHYRPIQITFTV